MRTLITEQHLKPHIYCVFYFSFWQQLWSVLGQKQFWASSRNIFSLVLRCTRRPHIPLNFFIFYTGETTTWDSRLATAGIGIAYPGPIKFSTAVVEDSLASVTFGVRIVDAPRNYGVADWMIIYIWLKKSFDVHGYRFRTSRLGMNKETLIRKTSVFLYYVFTCFSKYTSKEFLNGVCFVSTDLTPRFSIPFMVRFVNSTPWF